jgi:hypothetical protein
MADFKGPVTSNMHDTTISSKVRSHFQNITMKVNTYFVEKYLSQSLYLLKSTFQHSVFSSNILFSSIPCFNTYMIRIMIMILTIITTPILITAMIITQKKKIFFKTLFINSVFCVVQYVHKL